MARRQGPSAVRIRSKKLAYHDKIAGDLAWDSIPTCKSAGIDVEYDVARLLHVPGATPDQVDYYVDLMKKVRETPEWKKLMSEVRSTRPSCPGRNISTGSPRQKRGTRN